MHFNKRAAFTLERDNVNIKRAIESTLGDLLEVVKVIREKIENQLYMIPLQYSSEKDRKIKAMLNISIFNYFYFRFDGNSCWKSQR